MLLLGAVLVGVAARGRATRLVRRATAALEGRPASDDDVLARVVRALEADAPTDARVQVEVVDGAVTVRGEVATRADAASVVDLLGAVDGVREVQGLLHLPTAAPTVLDVAAHPR